MTDLIKRFEDLAPKINKVLDQVAKKHGVTTNSQQENIPMTEKQFLLIVERRFPRLSDPISTACYSVIFEGATAYAAESEHGCSRGTVSRYVNKIYGEVEFCKEVAAHE